MKLKPNDTFKITRKSDNKLFKGTIRDVHGTLRKTYDINLVDDKTGVLTSFDGVSGEWFKIHEHLIDWK